MSTTSRSVVSELPIASPLPRDAEVSFEFFPPKTDKMDAKLWDCVERLAPLKPKYVSVTYGAGGSTRERTHATVTRIRDETDIAPAAHLTCVGATREEIDDIARDYWAHGIKHIVALRGDPMDGIETDYVPHPGGYAYAEDLVKGLKKIADFEISVAGYPEKHPQAQSLDADIEFLKRKVDAGADRVITQSFFDNDKFLQFVDKARAAGITVPIVPGILPVTNFKRVQEFSTQTGTSVPRWMAEIFEGLDDDMETRKLVAATVVAEQCRVLYANGIKQFHFYTLNRADLTYAICHILGVRP
ncbi:MAG: methylenetetrahydrofolate reductase [NAD(P)H] [Rhodospirillaceae bacterium]|nr:MAG: methylenetetrahydrofolate reductase [NAD(P)H] [Rhodospirillaceae bacterium]